jgi:hypothetical protein
VLIEAGSISLSMANRVHAAVGADAAKPRLQGPSGVEFPNCAERFNEGVLDGVVGVLWIPQDSKREGPEHRSVHVAQKFEGRLIPRRGAFGEVRFPTRHSNIHFLYVLQEHFHFM